METDSRALALRALVEAIAVLEDAIADHGGDAGEAGTMWDPVAEWAARRFHGRTLAGPWVAIRGEPYEGTAYERIAAHPSFYEFGVVDDPDGAIARAVCRVDMSDGRWRAAVGDRFGTRWRSIHMLRWATPEAAAFAVDALLRSKGASLAPGGALVPEEGEPLPEEGEPDLFDDDVHPTLGGYRSPARDAVDALEYAMAPIAQSNADGIGPDPDPRPVLGRGLVWDLDSAGRILGGTDETP